MASPAKWLAQNKLSVGLIVFSTLLAIAVIVLAVELSDALADDEDPQTPGVPPSSTTPHPPLEPWQQELRVPPDVVPISYNVTLRPDLPLGVFYGNVSIQMQFSAERSWIPIHIKQLEIATVHLLDANLKEVSIRDMTVYEPNEFLVIFPEASIPIGNYTLNIVFTGSLKDKITGFYESVYTDNRGQRVIATSKFEPVDARAAFPCFDEPGLKAHFSISLVRPENGYSALSNMPIESEKPGPGNNEVTVNFRTSVSMSTYLVCFIVSDFLSSGPEVVQNKGEDLPVQVFATPQQVPYTALAKSVALQVTAFYLDYFKIRYPLPKLDLIAIPDFVSGAMEHWGLITFRETALLFDAATNSASAQKRVASVVAHEIAHQWFGNLVTMAWWDDLWLNEGFASFMESKALTKGVAECAQWQMLDQVVYDDIQPVLQVDAALNSHPIVQSVANPDQINQLFDSVSYDKGQAVLRMLENFMGEDAFRHGLTWYLSTHSFGNAKTQDLWSALDLALNIGGSLVSQVMATWTEQMGFPVVHVTREADTVILTQQRYLADRDLTFNASDSPYRYKWDIPIRYTTSEDASPALVWLNRSVDQLKLPINNLVTYVKINTKQVGFYRVNYEPKEWKVLTQNLPKLEPLDRAHLLDDVFSLAGSGHTNYSNALDMVKYLKTETEYLPWASGSTALSDLQTLLAGTSSFPAYRNFVVGLVSGLYGSGPNQFSWVVPNDDSHLNRLLRVKILGLACSVGHPQCLYDVGVLFKQWLVNTRIPVAADVRSLLYFYGMKSVGKEEEWNQLWNIYLKETNAQERINFLQALANAQEPWIIQRYLDYAWSESNVRSQDYLAVLGYIAKNPVGAPIVWDFFRGQWPALVQRFGLQHRTLGSTILSITATFTTQLRLDELRAFYAAYPDAGAGVAPRKNAEEKIATRIKWTNRNLEQIQQWLSTNA